MSEEDLELLITLDDPGDEQEEDTFNHQAENTLEFWLGKPYPEGKSKLRSHKQRISDRRSG